jgi:hypothetical protein
LTYGTVNSVDARVTINYGDGLGNNTLKNQIRSTPDTSQNALFSDHGDSGSAIVDGANKVIGLLFGGSNVATYANPIQFALDELNVDLGVKTLTLVTTPIICEPIVTKPIVCVVKTNTVICQIATRPAICRILTTPSVCLIKTTVCPGPTRACPPLSLACGPGRGPGPGPLGSTSTGEGGTGALDELYGNPGTDPTDEAFWLGYYTALDALDQAEKPGEE